MSTGSWAVTAADCGELTDKTTAEVFSDLDEQLAMGLAAAAGVVIENARLYGRLRRREAALSAIHEVIAFSAAGNEGSSALQLISVARTRKDPPNARATLDDRAPASELVAPVGSPRS